MVLAQIKELKDIRVPRLQVNGKGTGTLVATLVNVTRSVVVHTKHRNDTVTHAIRTSNVRTRGTNAVDVETNTTSRLANHRACLERVVNALNRIFLHAHKEARRHLWVRCTGVE